MALSIEQVQQTLPPSTLNALQGADFGGDFLGNGGGLQQFLNAPEEIMNTALFISQDVADNVVGSVGGIVTNVASGALDTIGGATSRMTDTVNAVMDITQLAITDMTNEVTNRITNAVQEMLALPTPSDVTSMVGGYTKYFLLDMGELQKKVISIKIPSLGDLTASLMEYIGKVVSFITEKVGKVTETVTEWMKKFKDFVDNIMDNLDQGLEWIVKKLGYFEAQLISALDAFLYGVKVDNYKITQLKETRKKKALQFLSLQDTSTKSVGKVKNTINVITTTSPIKDVNYDYIYAVPSIARINPEYEEYTEVIARNLKKKKISHIVINERLEYTYITYNTTYDALDDYQKNDYNTTEIVKKRNEKRHKKQEREIAKLSNDIIELSREIEIEEAQSDSYNYKYNKAEIEEKYIRIMYQFSNGVEPSDDNPIEKLLSNDDTYAQQSLTLSLKELGIDKQSNYDDAYSFEYTFKFKRNGQEIYEPNSKGVTDKSSKGLKKLQNVLEDKENIKTKSDKLEQEISILQGILDAYKTGSTADEVKKKIIGGNTNEFYKSVVGTIVDSTMPSNTEADTITIKSRILRKLIKLECRKLKKQGIVGQIKSIKYLVTSTIALSIATVTARSIRRLAEKPLKKAQEEIDKAKAKVINKAKTKAMKALCKLALLGG